MTTPRVFIANDDRLARSERLGRVGSWEWDPQRRQVECSQELQRLLGLPAATSTEGALLRCVPADDRGALRKALEELVQDGARARSFEHRVLRPDGSERRVRHEIERMPAENGRWFLAGALRDVTPGELPGADIDRPVDCDALTGLPTREHFVEQLGRALSHAGPGSGPALFVVGLDRMLRVNESQGRKTGDRLIAEIALRLRSWSEGPLAPGTGAARVARLGGGVFGVLLESSSHREDPSGVARSLLEVIAAPLEHGSGTLVPSASAGIALAPEDGEDPETLLAHAETALFEARQEGPSHSRRYASGHTQVVQRRLLIEAGLRSALANGGLSLHYQPIVEATSGRIAKLEALLRWSDPVLGAVSPAEFVPIAEKQGLIVSLGHWALREALRQLHCWERAGLAIGMSVNVSALQLRSPGFVAALGAALAESGADPRHVDLELTEGVLIGDEPEVTRALAAIKEMGLGLLIDDFGTGYCSLRYLQQLRIDALKVDRAFVSRIEDRQGGAALVAAIIAIAHRLGLLAIAEGVENFIQEDFLRSEGCDLLQGFSLGLPCAAEDLENRLLREAERAQ